MQKQNRAFYNRRSARLRDYDYSQAGLYFVTICTFQKACRFGEFRGGTLILNELGKLVQEIWLHIPVSRSNTTLDKFVVMPNHVHGIIGILENENTGKCATATPSAKTLPSGSLGATIGQFKSVVTKQSRALPDPPKPPIWQRNYHEHIIRNETELNEIRKYILENPAHWTNDDLYVD